jgi:hypothetical protein
MLLDTLDEPALLCPADPAVPVDTLLETIEEPPCSEDRLVVSAPVDAKPLETVAPQPMPPARHAPSEPAPVARRRRASSARR